MQDPGQSLVLLQNVTEEREIDAVVVVYLLNSIVTTPNFFRSFSDSIIMVKFIHTLFFILLEAVIVFIA